jgi:Leucine-rich repeat (LRR) protein
MESVQDRGSNRLGGGVFVVRTTKNSNPSADIPSDMTEEHFNTLPLTLQEALLEPNAVTSLKMYEPSRTEWIPEIERLKNLTHLEMTTGMDEIPDEISKLTKLQSLSITRSNIQKISIEIAELKNLEELDLFSNKLTQFPLPILELKNLRVLGIGGNDIETLPEEINRLVNLEYLGMTSTNIITLPKSMIEMKKLFIDDSQNLVKKVPEAYNHLFDYTKSMEKNY